MATVDCFLKIEGIAGESHDAKHKGEIDVASWCWGEKQRLDSATGQPTGRILVEEVHCSMPVSKASPVLMQACSNGQHFNSAVLTCRKAGKDQQEYFKVHFTRVVLGSYEVCLDDSTNGVLTEKITLHFQRIEFEYKEQKPDGTLGAPTKGSYDNSAHTR